MSLPASIASLFHHGRIELQNPHPPTGDELQDTTELLVGLEQPWRLEMPGQAPPFDREAALWAAVRFYRACQFTVFREIDAATVQHELNGCHRRRTDAAVVYSVDLTFRFLPDLLRLARSAAENDPLVDCLRQWAADWPLSSVGVPGMDAPKLDDWIQCPSLLTLYTDRIVSKRDSTRAAHPAVQAELRRSIGGHEELRTAVAPLLTKEAGIA